MWSARTRQGCFAEPPFGALRLAVSRFARLHLKANESEVLSNVRLLPVLPYRTELNPVERIGDLIKADATANRVFESVQAIEK